MKSPIKSLEEILQTPIERKEKSGFFDLEKNSACSNPEHKPPTHLHIPQGKGYKHICPSCGQISILIPPQISF